MFQKIVRHLPPPAPLFSVAVTVLCVLCLWQVNATIENAESGTISSMEAV